MAKTLSDSERIENYFTSAGAGEAEVMLSKIQLILRVRGIIEKPKRGRPISKKAPPISVKADGFTTEVRQ